MFIQLDTFHAQKVDGNLTHLIRDYAGKYAHVQIAGLPDRHEPDDGEINYPWLFRLFDEVGYQAGSVVNINLVASPKKGLAGLTPGANSLNP